jgi:hypothetical protein
LRIHADEAPPVIEIDGSLRIDRFCARDLADAVEQQTLTVAQAVGISTADEQVDPRVRFSLFAGRIVKLLSTNNSLRCLGPCLLIRDFSMSSCRVAASCLFVATLLAARVGAQTPAPSPHDPPTFQSTVQVTATRFGEPVAEVPGSISVITGDEIRARGATDLRAALALLGGVSVAPGGDAGRCER